MTRARGSAYTCSRGILGDKGVAAVLDRDVRPLTEIADNSGVVIGWGAKPNTLKAKQKAANSGLPYWSLEDGFFCYTSHPALDSRRLSYVVDKTGIYYDASRPSDLENLLNCDDWYTDTLKDRACAAIANIRKWHLSKYNAGQIALDDCLAGQLARAHQPILVVDQTAGDMSIELGAASADSFAEMLACAIQENPESDIFVKTHPDVLAGKKKGHFDRDSLPEGVCLIAGDIAPDVLIQYFETVYVVTSQLGFDALIAGKLVYCFGMPFYAGWGLTKDRLVEPRRRVSCSLEKLFAAACIKYCRYIDPFEEKQIEIEDCLDFLIAERQKHYPRSKRAVFIGFSLWKRGFIHAFLGPYIGRSKFISAARARNFDFEKQDVIVTWGRRHDELLLARDIENPVWRMEDAFIRSVGLGSDLMRPSSLVCDGAGIYYDGTYPSDIETFLRSHEFSDREEAQGKRLIAAIIEAGISKYNIGLRQKVDFRKRAVGRHVILVPGQVETDASIHYGSPNLKTNRALLAQVRLNNPDAFIIYKPHPDVVSGNREGGRAHQTESWTKDADLMVTDIDIIECLMQVDSVHTMTSLTGFEALIRGIDVHTYGLPFYAGWGLTHDQLNCSRRNKNISLEALVYSVLVVYSRHAEWPDGSVTSPMALLKAIGRAKEAVSGSGLSGSNIFARWCRKITYLVSALRQ